MPWDITDRVIRFDGKKLKKKREELVTVLNNIKEKKRFAESFMYVNKEQMKYYIQGLKTLLTWAEENAETKAYEPVMKR